MARHEIEGDQVATRLEVGRALEVGEQEGQAGDLRRWSTSSVSVGRCRGRSDLRAPLGVRTACACRQRMQRVAGESTPGSTPPPVLFSASGAAARTQLDRIRCEVELVEDDRQILPPRVGSPLDVDEVLECVTGSNMMRKLPAAAATGSPSPRAVDEIEGDLLDSADRNSPNVDARAPETAAAYSASTAGSDHGAAIRRTRGLTVKVTSTISSSVGSYPRRIASSDIPSCERLSASCRRRARRRSPAPHVPREIEQPEARGMQERRRSPAPCRPCTASRSPRTLSRQAGDEQAARAWIGDAAAAAIADPGPRRRADRRSLPAHVLDFATRYKVDTERAIAAFLHAARLGLFRSLVERAVPGCGGVLDAGTT